MYIIVVSENTQSALKQGPNQTKFLSFDHCSIIIKNHCKYSHFISLCKHTNH